MTFTIDRQPSAPKRQRARVWTFFGFCLLEATFVASHARAAEPAPDPNSVAEAQLRFRRGLELYDEGNPEAALIELRRAYDAAPNYKLFFNIAQVEHSTNDYASALAAFERYLAEGGSEILPKRRLECQKELEKLRSRVALLTLTTNVPDAVVTLDDGPPLPTPLKPNHPINPGRHKLTVSKQGYSEASRTIEVAGADLVNLTVELVEAKKDVTRAPMHDVSAQPSAASASATAPPSSPSPSRDNSWMWVGWGVTGALAVGAIATGVAALGASNDLAEARGSYGVPPETLDSKRATTKNLALVSDICLVGALAAGGVSLYLTISRPASSSGKTSGSLAVRLSAQSLEALGTF